MGKVDMGGGGGWNKINACFQRDLNGKPKRGVLRCINYHNKRPVLNP